MGNGSSCTGLPAVTLTCCYLGSVRNMHVWANPLFLSPRSKCSCMCVFASICMCHTWVCRWVSMCVMLMLSAELPWCGQQASHVCYILFCHYWDVKHRCVCTIVFNSVPPVLYKFSSLFSYFPSSADYHFCSPTSSTPVPHERVTEMRSKHDWDNGGKICKSRWERKGCMGTTSHLDRNDKNRLSSMTFLPQVNHRGCKSGP